MPGEDPDLTTKLATLQTMQRSGQSPRVAELLLVEWPSPDGPIYYGTRIAVDLLDNEDLLDRLEGGVIELRLGEGMFLDINATAGISDDRIDLDFYDADNEITRLTAVHGYGMRVEVFYYFPDVDLLLTEWWGHLQPPDKVSVDRFKCSAESGFRSSNLPLPSRAFFSGCQAVFGGLLTTQAEIDEGDCPYSAHLGLTPTSTVDTDATWKQTNVTPATGWQDLAFDDSGWSGAVEQGPLDTFPWNNTFGHELPDFPPSTPAQWIWSHDSRSSFDTQTVYFRKTFTADGPQAILVITADNGFVAYLNGQQIASGNDWTKSITVALTLVEGEDYVLAVQALNSGVPSPGGLIAEIAYGIQGVGFGLMDPDTDLPFTSCPRNNKAACTARLGDARSYLAFDTVIESHTVNETKGPNITVTSRGNETNLRRPLRVIAGHRHVSDLDLLTFVVEPNTNHPDQGSVKCLFANCEGPVQSVANGKINGATIGPQHLNYRIGERRQPATSFSPQISNYSGTSLFLGVAQGNFNSATADDLRGEVDIDGLNNVRVYSDQTNYVEQYTSERGWWLLHCFRNKRWGYGLDARRVYIPDFLDIATWCKEIVSVKDKDGNTFTGQRTQFNAELIDRTAQQQINDICLSGRFGLPFPDKGKLRVIPLRRASELFSAAVFTDKAFFGALDRPATTEERTEWFEALLDAREESPEALLAECQERLVGLFNSDEYDDRDRTDEEFVGDCYRAFLRREPDAEGLAFWTDPENFESRDHVLAAFSESIEFVTECTDSDVPLFTDRGDERNICWESDKTTLVHSIQSDADLPNRIIVNYDDSTKENKQIPLTFEDVEQQLRAGRAFGDTSRRAVEKEYVAFGVTDAGEAARLGNLLLDLGEFDEGGVQNNLRVTFTSWYLYAVALHKYQVIRVASDKLDVLNDVRVDQGKEPFTYFRIRSIRRLPNLLVEIEAQAYPVEYYERLELLTQGPGIPPSGPPTEDPGDPGVPGPTGRLPFDLDLTSLTHNDDQILFTIGTEAV